MKKVCLRSGQKTCICEEEKEERSCEEKNNSTAFTNVTVDHPAYNGEIPGPSRTPTNTDTISQKKLSGQREKMRFNNETEDENNVLLAGYRFIDLEVLTGVLDMIASCPNCGNKIKLLQTKKQGLSFQLKVVCQQG